MTFGSASQTPAAVTANTLDWTFSNLAPFESRYINVGFHVAAPPLVNNSDVFYFTSVISSPVPDETYLDNTVTIMQVATGSFDPNDKQVSTILTQKESPLEYLGYTIHFQNIGSASAENVMVSDALDSRFDLNSLIFVSASHPYRSRLTDNRLEFMFDNINLPGATVDEPGSQGYVSFKIKPIEGSVNAEDFIENKASIYFDFNLPIVTNSAQTFYYTILANEAFENKNLYALSPNPVKGMLNITVSDAAAINSMNIYNTLGQLVKSIPNKDSAKSKSIDVTELKAGTYLIEILSDKGKMTKKFIKL